MGAPAPHAGSTGLSSHPLRQDRLQVLKSDKAPTADHWMWVRAAGPPGRQIVLFDYDPPVTFFASPDILGVGQPGPA
jgi:hypothetical protein